MQPQEGNLMIPSSPLSIFTAYKLDILINEAA